MQGTNELRGTTLIPVFEQRFAFKNRLFHQLNALPRPVLLAGANSRYTVSDRRLTWEYHTGHFLRMLPAGDILSLQGYQVL